MKPTFPILAFLFLPFLSLAQNQFPNTLPFQDSISSPNASLDQLDWIAGYWKGEAFGGTTEEVWTPDLGGSMMCTFKLVVDNEVVFYELLTISEENNTLILKLKHFDKELKGWETKDETVDFKLVKVEKDKIYFDQFTFEKDGKRRMNIYVVLDEEGKQKEVKFAYTKVKL